MRIRELLVVILLTAAPATPAAGQCYVDEWGNQICPSQMQPYEQQPGWYGVASPPLSRDPNYTAPLTPEQQAIRWSDPYAVKIRNSVSRGFDYGSGCVLAVDGQARWIVTCGHATSGPGDPVLVIFGDGTTQRAITREWQKDPNGFGADAAILELTTPRPAGLPLAEIEPAVGATVYTRGFPDGGEFAARQWQVSKVNNDGVFELSAGAIGGESGSVVTDTSGYIVGVLWGSNHTTYSCCTRLGVLRRMLDRLFPNRPGRIVPHAPGRERPQIEIPVPQPPAAQAQPPQAPSQPPQAPPQPQTPAPTPEPPVAGPPAQQTPPWKTGPPLYDPGAQNQPPQAAQPPSAQAQPPASSAPPVPETPVPTAPPPVQPPSSSAPANPPVAVPVPPPAVPPGGLSTVAQYTLTQLLLAAGVPTGGATIAAWFLWRGARRARERIHDYRNQTTSGSGGPPQRPFESDAAAAAGPARPADRGGESSATADGTFQYAQRTVGPLERDAREGEQLLQLGKLEGRDPLQDAIAGRIIRPRLEAIAEGDSNPLAQQWALKLLHELDSEVNRIAPFKQTIEP